MITRVKEKLAGKKVLFITPKFYHYGEAVNEKIKSYGADVSFYYERNTSLLHVAIANFFPSQMNQWQDSHYRKILKETSHISFDYVIVIRGYKMQSWFIQTIRERNPNVYTILYQWDLFSLWDSDYRHLMPYFDKTLSFDYRDCDTLNIPYAPTFHMDEYAAIKSSSQTFDFIYCANHTDEKYEFLKKFLDYSAQKGYRIHTHLYISWFKFLKENLRGNNIGYHHVSFRRLKRKEYFELFSQSKTVVDFSATTQSGITMRVIDALGSGKRVLTNNGHVTQEPGFDPRQVVLYNPRDFSLPEDVLQEENFKKRDYSIDKWLDNLFFAT